MNSTLRRTVVPALLGLLAATAFLAIMVGASTGTTRVLDVFADFLDISVPAEPLRPGETWRQAFVPGQDCITRAEVLMLTYGGSNTAPVTITLEDGAGQAIATRTVPSGTLADGRFLTLDLDPACGSRGPLTIAVTQGGPSATPVALWTTPRGGAGAGALTRTGSGPVPPGTLVFRTYALGERNLYTRLDADRPAGLGSVLAPLGLAVAFALVITTIVLLARAPDPPDDTAGETNG